MTAHMFQGKDGQWYFHFRARNHQIVAQSEGYTTKAGAKRALQNFIIGVADVVVVQ